MPQAANSWTGEYRKLWLKGDAPSVEEFVSLRGTQSVAKLVDLLIVDQSLRWDAKDSTTAEQYFDRFPELLNHAEPAIDLIYSEFLLRERSGLNPLIDEYVDRFPQYSQELRRQDAFHRAIGNGTNRAIGNGATKSHPAEGTYQKQDAIPGHLETGTPDIPGYKILGELGRGGIGVVYQARHVQLNRLVALKMLLAGHFASPGLLRRFLVEAEATARLQHPGIVQIYEVGQHDGRPFLALEYINGGTLAQWNQGRPVPSREAASIIQSLAATVQFAHEQGVVHRDLKPGNVLIQQLARPAVQEALSTDLLNQTLSEGDVCQTDPQWAPTDVADTTDSDFRLQKPSSFIHPFQLKIADFGLAKLVASDSNPEGLAATMSGDILGTPAYMSPEQARGDTANLSAQTDIYSLGAILYELLTARPPFVGVQPLEVLGQVIADEPVRPSQLVRRMPNDIQTICLKCLEKSPARRYSSAGELADDLGRFLNDQPIIARHTSSYERSWRWCRRHPVKTSLVASIATILIMIAVVSSIYSFQLAHQLTLTSEANDKSEASRIEALQQLWVSQLAQADAIRTSDQAGRRYDALESIEVARDLGKSINFTPDQIDRMRNATLACLAQPDIRIVKNRDLNGETHAAVVALDKLRNRYASVQNNEMVVRRLIDGSQVARFPVSDPDSIPLLSENGKRLAIVNDYCRVYSLDDSPAKLIYETASLGAWGFTPDGSAMLGTAGDGALCLVDLYKGSVIKSFGAITAKDEISISPNGQRAAVYDGQSIQIIELTTAYVSLKIERPRIRGLRHFAWHPNSNVLAIGPFENDGVELWDVENAALLDSFDLNTGQMIIGFSSTGERLLTFDCWGSNLRVWNVSSGEVELSKFAIDLWTVTADQSGGFHLLQANKNSQLETISIEQPGIYHCLSMPHQPGAAAHTSDMAFSPDGHLIAVVNQEDLWVFDSHSYQELGRLDCGYCYINFDQDQSLLTSTASGLALWKLAVVEDSQRDSRACGSLKHFQLGPPEFLSDAVSHAPFVVSRDGQTIAISTGNEIQLQTTGTSKSTQTIGPQLDIRRLSFSPDGKRLASGGWEGGKACVWDIKSGKLLHVIDEPFCMVQFSPNGKWLVTNSERVRIWDAENWSLVQELPVEGLRLDGTQVCFSPDSSMLAVTDSDATISLFDPVNGRVFAILTDPFKGRSSHLKFSPDGSQLAVMTNGNGGEVHIWDLALIREQLLSRNLGWSSDDSIPEIFKSESKRGRPSPRQTATIASLKFEPDQQFLEIEAARQYDLLKTAADNFEIKAARAAIAKIIKLQPQRALTCNNLAWTLATGPQPLRDSATAVEFARRAIADETLSDRDRALYINTLGVALYRDDRIDEAIKILEKSLAIQTPDSQPFDLYFLSMCSARLGEQKKARDYFDRAEAMVQQFKSQMPFAWQTELTQFAQEARLMLHDQLSQNRQAIRFCLVTIPTDEVT